MSVLSQAVTRRATVGEDYDHQIVMVDTSELPVEQPAQAAEDTIISRTSTSIQRAETAKSVSSVEQQARKKRNLRDELMKRKWSKYQESRYSVPKLKGTQDEQDGKQGSSKGQQENTPTRRAPLDLYPDSRGRQGHRRDDSLESAVEVLYENQRGICLCGMPMFSSKSLLNLDPSAWTNGAFKTSLVNITNAQVPNPSWTWAWKSWYVDMSLDVDEEGWQYSFSFQPYFSWHGTHVWFHSFVRRRRWLRKRIRARSIDGIPGKGGQKTREASMLNDDYFTVHSRVKSRGSSLMTGITNPQSSLLSLRGEQEDEGPTEIKDIGSLVKALRAARIDREKVEAITSFVHNGGDELIYLVDRMPDIMGFFIFQESRRQLLELLMHRFDAATEQMKRDEEAGKDDLDADRRRLAHLEGAVDAADEQVKHLQYWSDAQGMTAEGLVKHATDKAHGWGDDWRGLDQSGPS